MSDPFLAEIRHVGFNFAPRGWAQCDGQILPINQNQSLFSLIGTTYGGDGRTDFRLPDFRGRAVCHVGALPVGGPNKSWGAKFGDEDAVLNADHIPSHTHTLIGSAAESTSEGPAGQMFGVSERGSAYLPGGPNRTLSDNALLPTGSPATTEHNNMQPFLTVNFVIAMQGTFPPRN